MYFAHNMYLLIQLQVLVYVLRVQLTVHTNCIIMNSNTSNILESIGEASGGLVGHTVPEIVHVNREISKQKVDFKGNSNKE